jgi:hypothetical protein
MAPDVSSGEARTYRTVIREGAKAGVNFAGHYTVVTIGCGTSCIRAVVIDRMTGKVQFTPVGPGLGVAIRVDSALLIADPAGMIRDVYREQRWMYSSQYRVGDEGSKSFRLLGERYLDDDADESRR